MLLVTLHQGNFSGTTVLWFCHDCRVQSSPVINFILPCLFLSATLVLVLSIASSPIIACLSYVSNNDSKLCHDDFTCFNISQRLGTSNLGVRYKLQAVLKRCDCHGISKFRIMWQCNPFAFSRLELNLYHEKSKQWFKTAIFCC